jgi:hypothetical protein
MKSKEVNEDCTKANEIARSQTLKQCKSVGLTSRRVVRRIKEGLDALENKVFYDKDRGKCVFSPDMINWSARQKAIDQAISILDLKPAEKHKVEHSGKVTLEDIVSGAIIGE